MIEGDPLWFRGETYWPYLFNCNSCGCELTSTAREVRTRPGYTAQDLVITSVKSKCARHQFDLLFLEKLMLKQKAPSVFSCMSRKIFLASDNLPPYSIFFARYTMIIYNK